MTTKTADDYESIARRLKEIEAERKQAMTGSSAPINDKKQDQFDSYGMYAYGDYACGYPLKASGLYTVIDHGPSHDGFGNYAYGYRFTPASNVGVVQDPTHAHTLTIAQMPRH